MFIEHVVVIFLLKILILSTAKPTNTIVAAFEKDLWANRKMVLKKAIFDHIKIEIKCPFQGYYIQKGPTSLA